jgi:hypothetical protein
MSEFVQQEESSFLKKSSKRLLLLRRAHDRGHGRDLSGGARIKVFLLLFLQIKKTLSTAFRCAARTPTLPLPTRGRGNWAAFGGTLLWMA